TAARKFIATTGRELRNQIGSPLLSIISAPRCPGPELGARNRCPSVTPGLRVVTLTTGGRRSGRETKSCTFAGSSLAAPAVSTRCAGSSASTSPDAAARRSSSRRLKLISAPPAAKPAAPLLVSLRRAYGSSDRLAAALDRRRAPEHASVRAERLDGEIGIARRCLHRRLEASLPDRHADRRQMLGRRTAERLPTCDLGCSVPARVDGCRGLALRDSYCWTRLGSSGPREAIRAIGVVTVRERRVVEHPPARRELGHARHGSPADERVAVRQQLRVPLADRERAVRVCAHEGCRSRLRVEADTDRTGLLLPFRR